MVALPDAPTKTLLYVMIPRGANPTKRKTALRQLDDLREDLEQPQPSKPGSVRITRGHTVETMYAIADVLSTKFPALAFEVDAETTYRTYINGEWDEWN